MNTTLLNWTIDQFQSHTKPGCYIDSPNFEPSNNHQIKLRLFPNGLENLTNGVNILMHFESCKLSEMNVLFKFSLVNSQGEHVHMKMLKNSKFYDVILCFGVKELKAHKNILSARSPVFEAMFEHDLEEKRKNRVHISDVSVEVFEVLLKYIYTGQVELDETFVAELLVAADKYTLENLKSQCEQWICSHLENDQTQSNVSSVVGLLILADMHNAKLLKFESIKYIVRNTNLVISTVKWTELMQTKPKLFNDVFKLMAQKLNTTNLMDNLEIE